MGALWVSLARWVGEAVWGSHVPARVSASLDAPSWSASLESNGWEATL
jgi:hypothetical protein